MVQCASDAFWKNLADTLQYQVVVCQRFDFHFDELT